VFLRSRYASGVARHVGGDRVVRCRRRSVRACAGPCTNGEMVTGRFKLRTPACPCWWRIDHRVLARRQKEGRGGPRRKEEWRFARRVIGRRTATWGRSYEVCRRTPQTIPQRTSVALRGPHFFSVLKRGASKPACPAAGHDQERATARGFTVNQPASTADEPADRLNADRPSFHQRRIIQRRLDLRPPRASIIVAVDTINRAQRRTRRNRHVRWSMPQPV
jgi:hypothetical protein